MAEEEDIVQRVRIEGDGDLLAAFQGIAAAGKQAFTEVRAAAADVGRAFDSVVKEARAANTEIKAGGDNAEQSLKRVENASRALGTSIRNVATTAGKALGDIGRAINVEPIATAIRRVVTTVGGLRSVFSTTFNAIRNSVATLTASLSANFAGRFTANLQQIEAASRRFGGVLREVGVGVGGFLRRIALIGGGAAAAVAAFRSMAQAATGSAAAERVASRERLADIRDEKGDITGLANIRNQSAEALRKLNNDYGRGKIDIQAYTASLQDLQEETAAATRQFLISDAQEASARKRQFESMRKLREEEAFNNIADKVGNQAAAAFLRLGTVIDQVANRARQILGPTLATIINGITNGIQANAPKINEFFQQIRDKLAPLAADIPKTFNDALPKILDFATGVTDAITGVTKIFQGLMVVLDGIAAAINEITGSNISGPFLLGAIAVLYFTKTLPILIGLIRGAAIAFGILRLAMSGPVAILITLTAALVAYLAASGKLGAASKSIGEALTSAFTGVLPAAQQNLGAVGNEINKLPPVARNAAAGVSTATNSELQKIPAAAKTNVGKANTELAKLESPKALDEVKTKADSTATAVANSFNNLVAPVRTAFEQMASAAEQAATRISAAIGGAVANFALGGPVGYDTGGRVRGPGTGTSDSILARLSNGEFVQRTAAVRYYGVDFMNALNNLRISKDALLGFATGGLVNLAPSLAPTPIMRFADGGSVNPPRNSLTLVLDGQSFGGMLAPDDVFEGLKKKAVRKSLSPRKPNWA